MAIKIKKSHRGLLHKNLGVAKGKKIPASKLSVKKGDSVAVKKRKIFAKIKFRIRLKHCKTLLSLLDQTLIFRTD